jgi:hypothetical protein
MVISGDLRAAIESQKREFENIRVEVERMKAMVREPNTQLLIPVPSDPSMSTSPLPMEQPESLDGIIAHLTKEAESRHLHVWDIISITSASVFDDNPKYAPRNAANLHVDSWLWSADGATGFAGISAKCA